MSRSPVEGFLDLVRLERRHQAASVVVSGAVLVIVVATFFDSPGTSDVELFLAWSALVTKDGLTHAYAAANDAYPPLTWVILGIVSRVSTFLDITAFTAFKASVVVFLCLTGVAYYLWTRKPLFSFLFCLSLVVNSVVLGYIDVYLAPMLIVALWALERGRLAVFATLFTVSALVKWQPLIVAPFLLSYVLRSDVSMGALITRGFLPVVVLVGAVAPVFGRPFVASLQEALTHDNLSGNALNYNWLLTHYLHVAQPERFGPLTDGLATYVYASDWRTVGVSRVLFATFYMSTLAMMWKRPKTMENLLRFMLTGYLAYFTFATGVHENHLFLANVFAAMLYGLWGRGLLPAISIVLMANVNLVLFFGLNGTFMRNKILGVDIALPLALLYVALFFVFWRWAWLASREATSVRAARTASQVEWMR